MPRRKNKKRSLVSVRWNVDMVMADINDTDDTGGAIWGLTDSKQQLIPFGLWIGAPPEFQGRLELQSNSP